MPLTREVFQGSAALAAAIKLTISIITATLRRERYCTYHCYDDDDDGYMAVVIIVVNCIIVLITARCDYDYE